MKHLICLAMLLFSFKGELTAYEKRNNPDRPQFIEIWGRGILDVAGSKVYLHPERLCFSQGEGLLLNDTQQWIPIGEVLYDTIGYYIDISDSECPNGRIGIDKVKKSKKDWPEPECPEGHIGIYRVKKIWYCNEPDCPYFIGENF